MSDPTSARARKLVKWIFAVPAVVLLIITLGISMRYVSNKARLDRLRSSPLGRGFSPSVSIDFENVVPDTIRRLVGQSRCEPFDQMKSITFDVRDEDLIKWQGSYDAQSIVIRSNRPFSDDDRDLTDRGLKTLGELRLLEDLHIYGGRFTGQGLSALARCPRLKRLTITEPIMSSDCYKVIETLPHLTELIIDKADDFTADEILAITRCRSLQIVRLNMFNGEAFRNTHLDALKNGVNWALGVRSLTPELLEPLTRLPRIDSLALDGEMEAQALRPLSKLPKLQALQITTWSITAADLQRLEGCISLKTLIIDCNNEGADHGLDQLIGLKSLTQLIMCLPDLTANDVQALSQLTQLTALRIELETSGELDFARLQTLTNLEELDLEQVAGFDRSFSILQSMPRLHWLRVRTEARLPHPLQTLMDDSKLSPALMSAVPNTLREIAISIKTFPDVRYVVVSIGQRKLLPKDRSSPA